MPKLWKLLPYQTRWVQDQSPIKIIEKSRRVGISYAEAYDAVMHAASAGGGSTSYVSFNLDMAKDGFMADCAWWARGLHDVATTVEQSMISDEGKQILVYAIRFDSGHKITALPSNARQLRSKGRPGDRIVIDEAAFVDNIDELLQAALATQVWGASIRIISTHSGELNPFNLLVRDIRAGKLDYSLHSVPLKTALGDGLFERIQEVTGSTGQTRDTWEGALRGSYRYPWQAAEELDCIPSQGAGGWLSLEDIHACEAPDVKRGPDDQWEPGGPVFIGWDVARRNDLSVFTVVEQLDGKLWLRELVALRDTSFASQEAVLARMIGQYNPVRIAVDQTGMGEALVEQAQRRHGASRVEGVIMTSGKRLDIATALRGAFEERTIRIPIDDALRADLRSIKRAPGVTGDRPRLIASGETDGHADRFWSLALAVAAAATPRQAYAFMPVKLGSAFRFGPDDDDEGTFTRYTLGRWSAQLRTQ